jgi:hypothetical protein
MTFTTEINHVLQLMTDLQLRQQFLANRPHPTLGTFPAKHQEPTFFRAEVPWHVTLLSPHYLVFCEKGLIAKLLYCGFLARL